MKEFSRKRFVLLICVSLILDWNGVLAVSWSDNRSTCCYEKDIFYCGSVAGVGASGCLKGMKYKISPFWCVLPIVAAGAVALGLPAVPAAVLGAAGFGAGGIGAGGLVAFLQSLGATGLASFVMTSAGQALMAAGCITEEEDG